MNWGDASVLAVVSALEAGQVGVLDPGGLATPWSSVATYAQRTPPKTAGAIEFARALPDAWCAAAELDRTWIEDRFWDAQQALNGEHPREYMNRARKAGDAARWGDAADRALEPADGGLKERLRRIKEEAGLTVGAPSDDWRPRSVLDGIDLDTPPPRPDLLGIAYSGKTHLVSGRPEAAKTWTAQVIGCEAIRLGGTVLILDTDGTGQRDIADRFLDLGLDRGALADVAYSDDPRELFNPATTPAVEAWIAEHAARGPVVVVIDSANPTLAALGFRLDEEGVTQLEAAVINPIKRAGGTIILIDHVAIHADRDSPYSIGTQRKHAAADVHLRLDSIGEPLTRGGNPAPFAIRGMKDRPGGLTRHGNDKHMGRITFTPNDNGAIAHTITLGPPTAHDERATWRPTVLMERISRWAELQPGAFSKRDAEKDVPGKGPALRAAVDALYSEGYLKAAGQRWQHARPYREQDDPEAAE